MNVYSIDWDECDCDQRCSKCGKKKKNLRPYISYNSSAPFSVPKLGIYQSK